MSYKVMGVTAGRKNSNSEILLKEALTACEELGAEVRMINLKDFKEALINSGMQIAQSDFSSDCPNKWR